jgi:ABC-type microcin C transport system duplicated ATPase subunit YejF
VALGYEPPADDRRDGRVWIAAGGSHCLGGLGIYQKARLLAAVLEHGPERRAIGPQRRVTSPERRAKLVLLGAEFDRLEPAERAALRARVAFLPASGGLLSSLNAWENIVLPLGFHYPKRLQGAAAQVHGLLTELGVDPDILLPKLPERMSPYEKKLTGYVRILMEKPELLLVDDLPSGLDPAEQAQVTGFPAAYLALCPGGTFVQLDGTRGA